MIASSRGEPPGSVAWPPSLCSTRRAARGRHIGRDAEPGAGPEHEHAAPSPPARAPPTWRRSLWREMRQRPGHGFEIVDQPDVGEAEAGAQLGRIDDPGVVREGAALAFDHAGHRKDRAADRAGRFGARGTRRARRRSARSRQHANVSIGPIASAAQHRKARIGAPDVAQQDALLVDAPATRGLDQRAIPIERRFRNAPLRRVIDVGETEAHAVAGSHSKLSSSDQTK